MEVSISGEFAGNGIATNRFFAKNGRLTVRGNESGVLSDDKRDFLARQRRKRSHFRKGRLPGGGYVKRGTCLCSRLSRRAGSFIRQSVPCRRANNGKVSGIRIARLITGRPTIISAHRNERKIGLSGLNQNTAGTSGPGRIWFCRKRLMAAGMRKGAEHDLQDGL